MNNIIIITAYRPDYHLIDLYTKLKELNFDNIVISDDGSDPVFSEIYNTLRKKGASVIMNETNSGKGMSIKNALTYVIKNFPDAPGVIIADGDGQHLPSDIKKISDELLKSENSIVQGIRNFRKRKIPFKFRARNMLSSVVYRIDSGKKATDIRTGLRGIPHSLIPFAASVKGKRFEYESNLIKEAAEKKIPIKRVAINTVFPKNNKVYYRPLRDSARIIKSPLVFMSASLSSYLVDIILFALLINFFKGRAVDDIFPATIIARIISGTVNFTINKTLNFNKKGKANRQLLKFILFFATLMLLSSTFVSMLSFIRLPLVTIKMMVDTVLFFVNFYVQKKWIFK